jgi:hypothetical protein
MQLITGQAVVVEIVAGGQHEGDGMSERRVWIGMDDRSGKQKFSPESAADITRHPHMD